MRDLEQFLRVGIIQTHISIISSWRENGKICQNMNQEAQNMALEEIRRGFKEFSALGEKKPRIILLPEYSIPQFAISLVEKMVKELDAVLIGGCDLFVKDGKASNKGVIIIPNQWPSSERAYKSIKKYFGKQFFSTVEEEWFNDLKLMPSPYETHFIIDAGPYGNVGVAICADFYDIERFAIYKGRIHHLIIIAYNKDTRSFSFLTEAISRLLMCNVVICNSGHYGDSLAYSPYTKEYKRIIFKHSGANLFSAQVVELPVASLDSEQMKMPNKEESIFKHAPGYVKKS